MTARVSLFRRSLFTALAGVLLVGAAPTALAGNELAGNWSFVITIPDAPGSKTTRTFTVNVDVSPRGESLHGRLTIADEAGMRVGGAWRQVGKNVSITYELPCAESGPCASLILLGKVKGGGMLLKKGHVIIMWDTANDRNPALYDTSNGSFRGTRID